jgi:hypothetical protein
MSLRTSDAVKERVAMKPPTNSDREFNTPAEMLTRATFLGVLTALTAGILLTIAGVLVAEVRLSVVGLAALGLAGMGRVWLQRRVEEGPGEFALECIAQNSPQPDESRSRQLLALLEEWESMEEKRGTPDFDPWALQALRNDIRKVVESDPALAQLFTELQRAA